ncbi:DUF1963 domain-containing protein [Streptomyces sp. NRRL S-495]|uniref:DUF1963 domain-containing protein n=1 Tax=Streptomyces sp. NRRL S-495 TaxID=1609133 RepID=UPI0005F8E13C|nr:DUF1963 domain-containing protein [Streptomyces sp. NRRL S-495]KJY36107.1 hypothetical protein VR45_12425 [Streptomyces sp. NRRL S-495]
MTTLITEGGPVAADATVTRTGGVPLAPPGTAWPSCADCGGPLQFLAQIVLDGSGAAVAGSPGPQDRVLVLFACQNRPGVCQDWEARSGANLALILPARGLAPIPLPVPADLDEDEDDDEDDLDAPDEDEFEEEVLLLGATRAAEPQLLPEAQDFDSARAAWAARTGRPRNHVLGQLNGTPAWLQYDQTPTCASCAEPMRLAVQFQEGPDPLTAMNFGSGRAYAFVCSPCTDAVFLWQC